MMEMMKRPSTHIRLQLKFPLIILTGLLVAAFVLPDRVWNTMLVGFGGMFLMAWLWVRALVKGLHGSRRLRFGWVSVGDRLEENFTLSNESWLPALWVEILDESNVPGYSTAVVRSVAAGETDHWRNAAICERRGQFHLGPWAIRSSDPFGLFSLTIDYPVVDEVIIHPPIYGRLPIPLPAGRSNGRVRASQRAQQATLNAASVRPYHATDPQRWIHWPTTARRDELFVREFDLDAAGDIWLLLDMQAEVQLGQGIESTEEQAVLMAASLAARALRQNRAVGLAGYGRIPQVVNTGRGQGQRWRILRALALVQADGDTNLSVSLRDLGQIARRGAAAIIITPNTSAAWLPDLVTLAQKGIESHVILLDRPSFGGEGHSLALQESIRRLGFNATITRRNEIGQPLLEQQRRGFWEFRVTGTGKVVTVHNPLLETN